MAPKKSEVGSKMVIKNFLLQIWVLCNPKNGTSELHEKLFLFGPWPILCCSGGCVECGANSNSNDKRQTQ
jgi:hypothetical protein